MRWILDGVALLTLLVPGALHAAAIPWMPPPATWPCDLPAWIAFTLLGVIAEGVRS